MVFNTLRSFFMKLVRVVHKNSSMHGNILTRFSTCSSLTVAIKPLNLAEHHFYRNTATWNIKHILWQHRMQIGWLFRKSHYCNCFCLRSSFIICNTFIAIDSKLLPTASTSPYFCWQYSVRIPRYPLIDSFTRSDILTKWKKKLNSGFP